MAYHLSNFKEASSKENGHLRLFHRSLLWLTQEEGKYLSKWGRGGGGQVVSVVAFYSNNLSSNPKVGSLQFLSKVVVEKKEIDKKRLCKEKFHCTTDLQFDWCIQQLRDNEISSRLIYLVSDTSPYEVSKYSLSTSKCT